MSEVSTTPAATSTTPTEPAPSLEVFTKELGGKPEDYEAFVKDWGSPPAPAGAAAAAAPAAGASETSASGEGGSSGESGGKGGGGRGRSKQAQPVPLQNAPTPSATPAPTPTPTQQDPEAPKPPASPAPTELEELAIKEQQAMSAELYKAGQEARRNETAQQQSRGGEVDHKLVQRAGAEAEQRARDRFLSRREPGVYVRNSIKLMGAQGAVFCEPGMKLPRHMVQGIGEAQLRKYVADGILDDLRA